LLNCVIAELANVNNTSARDEAAGNDAFQNRIRNLSFVQKRQVEE
jgi:hypothetical protein